MPRDERRRAANLVRALRTPAGLEEKSRVADHAFPHCRAKSLPSGLVGHTKKTADKNNCQYAGENALPRHDRRGFEQMQNQCFSDGKSIASFTYLRLGEDLLDGDKNWFEFCRFATEMKLGRRLQTWSAIPLSRQSKRGDVPHLSFDHPHTQGATPASRTSPCPFTGPLCCQLCSGHKLCSGRVGRG